VYLLLWDASALAQRYAPEVGHQTVNALFAATARAQMATTILTYSETCAALVRKRNQGALDTAIFTVGPVVATGRGDRRPGFCCPRPGIRRFP
jgi:hypothetical protein